MYKNNNPAPTKAPERTISAIFSGRDKRILVIGTKVLITWSRQIYKETVTIQNYTLPPVRTAVVLGRNRRIRKYNAVTAAQWKAIKAK